MCDKVLLGPRGGRGVFGHPPEGTRRCSRHTAMTDKVLNKSPTTTPAVSKGVARGHILCCVAVVFVCFMLTCLNLYMMSSTRSVLRSLDSRLEGRPAAARFQQQALQPAPEVLQQALQAGLEGGADDFILLAPGDLDNAWTTQTGRLLVPVGQPEEDDNGWKQMQVQLAAQTSAQQRHIESLHDKLADQYQTQHELLREHHKLAQQHQRQIAKKDRQLLKEKHRGLKQDIARDEEVRRYQGELDQLKQVVDAVQALDASAPTADPAPTCAAPTAAAPSVMVEEIPAVSNASQTVIEVSVPILTDAADATDATADAPSAAASSGSPSNSLDHIFSAVFGPNPGSFFFPSYSAAADKPEDAAAAAAELPRVRRDLAAGRQERRERRLSLLKSRMEGRRRRRHNQDPIMRIDGGEMVPLQTPAVLDRA